jgi:hypothetical protein
MRRGESKTRFDLSKIRWAEQSMIVADINLGLLLISDDVVRPQNRYFDLVFVLEVIAQILDWGA